MEPEMMMELQVKLRFCYVILKNYCCQETAGRKKDAMKESMEKWRRERELNADYIAQMKQAKEERKREIEAQEALLLQMKEEEEAEEEAAAQKLGSTENLSTEPADKKPVEADEKKNFGDQKKLKSKNDNDVSEAMNKLIEPFDLATMDAEQIKTKIAQLYDIFTNLINDKINLNKKLVEQDGIMKILREKLNEILDARAAKKGQIDMHKFYPGKKTSHPPKMQIFSKYDNRKGTRSYDERKEMYNVGTDVVRPQMLISMWDEKFNAWLEENDEE